MRNKKGWVMGMTFIVIGLIAFIWLLYNVITIAEENIRSAEDYCADRGLLYFKLNCPDDMVTCYELGNDDLMKLKTFKFDACE